jgi:hypothetical protein
LADVLKVRRVAAHAAWAMPESRRRLDFSAILGYLIPTSRVDDTLYSSDQARGKR